jgi:hypothetical protein
MTTTNEKKKPDTLSRGDRCAKFGISTTQKPNWEDWRDWEAEL